MTDTEPWDPAAGLPAYLARALAASGYPTQTALAHAAGIDPSRLSKILAGKHRPTIVTLRRLALALGRPEIELAQAAGYPVPALPGPPPPVRDPRLAALIAELEHNPAFMAQLRTLQPTDTAAIRDLAQIFLLYLRGRGGGTQTD